MEANAANESRIPREQFAEAAQFQHASYGCENPMLAWVRTISF